STDRKEGREDRGTHAENGPANISTNISQKISRRRYDSGTFGDIWPLGHVTLSLYGPFLSNIAMAAVLLDDVCYPETQITLVDLHLPHYMSVQPFKDTFRRI
ncbi:hypothetical protein ATANTOWER_032433, partial [Ataeniobius toweri]|nr:hypothetical protein [Ataeniobius toweri]